MSRHQMIEWSPGTAGPLLPDDLPDLSWQEQGLCTQSDPDAWFPEKGGSTREPKKICRRCPVIAECLEYALEHDERFGVWGGLSERERRQLKRTAPAAVVPAPRKPRQEAKPQSAPQPAAHSKPATEALRSWRPQGTYGWPAKKELAA